MVATADAFNKDQMAQQHSDVYALKRHLRYKRQASHTVYTVQIYMIVDLALYIK